MGGCSGRGSGLHVLSGGCPRGSALVFLDLFEEGGRVEFGESARREAEGLGEDGVPGQLIRELLADVVVDLCVGGEPGDFRGGSVPSGRRWQIS